MTSRRVTSGSTRDVPARPGRERLTRGPPKATSLPSSATDTSEIPEHRLTDRGLETEFLERTLSLSSGLLYWVVLTIVVT